MDIFTEKKIVAPILSCNKPRLCNSKVNNLLLNDTIGGIDLIDTRKFISCNKNSQDNIMLEEIPTKIQGNYSEDYNITHVDEIIRKKLSQDIYTYLPVLKLKYENFQKAILQPQTYIMREKTLESMREVQEEINQIESGEKIKIYDKKVNDILTRYKKFSGKVKVLSFNIEEEEYKELDDELREKLFLIDSYLDIASQYIQIDIIRINNRPSDICTGCGMSLVKVATNEEGMITCPNLDCQTEHNVVILSKLAKDGPRVSISGGSDDESIDNFMRAFIRYQGLQPDRPPDYLYDELDTYFIRDRRLTGEEIRKLPLNNRGERGDTNHKMLWDALSQIGRSNYYEDANLIGHIYWGWTLPNVMHLKERIIDKYNKTQRVFYRIPPKERCRDSSLGTQLRLYLHLRLEGQECYIDQFKIAENLESLQNQIRLWKLMCEGADDPDIYYISW